MAQWIDDLAVEEVETPTLLEWQPAGGIGGLIPGGSYTISAVHLTDLASNAAAASATFTHINTTDKMLLLAYQPPTDTQPEAQSAYGLTTLFRGRTWHPDLGMYYYRARWYLPEAAEFGERDSESCQRMANAHIAMGADPSNLKDPMGRRAVNPTSDGEIHVRPLYKTVLVKLDPICSSKEWTKAEIREQLEEARRIFSSRAGVFLYWGVMRNDKRETNWAPKSLTLL